MNDQAVTIENQKMPPPLPSHRIKRIRKPSFIAKLALVLVLINLVALAWLWMNTRQRFNEIEKTLSRKLEQHQAVNQQSLALAKQADDRSVKTQAQTILIEQKLAESRDQQEVLQTLYNQLAENREMRAVAEVEQLVTIANQQLQLSGNVKSALLALQAADQQLEPLNLPRATQLREVLGNEIEKLRQFPQVDLMLMAAQLESLSALCANLPLISERLPTLDKIEAQQQHLKMSHLSQLQAFAYNVWADIQNLVTVERIDKPEPPLLSADHQFYLRENLKLRLLSARIALMQHDEVSYNADLKTISQWLNQYYDVKHPNALKALNLLGKLSDHHIGIELPQLNESLAAISRYKLTLEKND
jgi:uroporphyrin-3 C-methyltransferase